MCWGKFQQSDLFYFTVISPDITRESSLAFQSNRSGVESLQRWAMNIIFIGYDYKALLIIAGVDNLQSSWETYSAVFYSARAERNIVVLIIYCHQCENLQPKFL